MPRSSKQQFITLARKHANPRIVRRRGGYANYWRLEGVFRRIGEDKYVKLAQKRYK